MLILYQPESVSAAAIATSVARHTGLDTPADLDLPREVFTSRAEAGSMLALGVQEAFAELDHRVQGATRGLLGLAGLVPLALTGWALREILRGRTAPLAWSTALWYAHGLFRDYTAPVARE